MKPYRYGVVWGLEARDRDGQEFGKFLGVERLNSRPFPIVCSVFELSVPVDSERMPPFQVSLGGFRGLVEERRSSSGKSRRFLFPESGQDGTVFLLARGIEDILSEAREVYSGPDAIIPFEIDLLQDGVKPASDGKPEDEGDVDGQ